MRILAIEREQPTPFRPAEPDLLHQEASAVWDLQKQDVIRAIWFALGHRAVIIMECQNAAEARQHLATLPLVRCGRVDFTVLELRSYDGFERLFATANTTPKPKREEPPEY